jgi:hypothetical protein
MHDLNTDVTYRVHELRQCAGDAHAERRATPKAANPGPNRVRLAIGNALVGIGTALAAPSTRTRLPSR